jgi:hypothetical protein
MTKEQLRMQMLAGIITESQYKAKLNENEDEAPLVITVKVTESGKNKLDLKTGPSGIRMTSDKNNSQMESDCYYIGNTEFKLGGGAKVYFAQYRHDIKEILVSYLVPKSPEEFTKLVNSQYISPRDMKGSIPSGNHKFDNGFEKGMKDHRGDFEII